MRSVSARVGVIATILAGALVAAPSGLAWSAPPTSAASAPAAVSASDIVTQVAPDARGVLVPGQDLSLTVRVNNAGSDTLNQALVQVAVSERLASPAQFQSWLDGSEFPRALTTVPVPPVNGGGSVDVRITLPAASLPVTAWGAYGLVARLQSSVGAIPDARSGFVYADGTVPPPTSITTIVPIVAPGSGGLLAASDLDRLMTPGGPLGRALDAVAGRPVALGVDPRLFASVRVLGSSAPASAVQWMSRLAGSGNDVFPLQYGDADPAVQKASGIPGLLVPTSFAYSAESGGATPLPGSPARLQTSDVLDWKYSASGIVWPAAGTVQHADLPYFASSGFTTTIVNSDQVSYANTNSSHGATATIDGARVLIADDTLSDGVTRALSASDPLTRDSGIALVSTMSAAYGSASGGRSVSVLAAVDRQWLSQGLGDDVAATVDALSGQAWTRAGTLGTLDAATPSTDAVLADASEDPARIATVSGLFGNEIQVGTFSTVVSEPALITGRVRNDLLATLAVQYQFDPDAWSLAVSSSTARTDAILKSVQVVDGSTINLLSSAAEIPITVSNDLKYPATVTVSVTPSNGRLVVGQSVTVTVEAGSRTTAKVPVTAGVANGDVTLTTRLLTPDGVAIAHGTPVTVNVSADWEGIGATVLAVLIGGFFAFSVIRFIIVRRKRRSPEAES